MRVLIVSPVPPEPPHSGPAQRVRNVVLELRRQGRETAFAYADFGYTDAVCDPGACTDLTAGAWHHRTFPFPWDRIPASRRLRIRLLQRLGLAFNWGVDDWCPAGVADWVATVAEGWRAQVVVVVYAALSSVAVRMQAMGIPCVLDTIDVFEARNRRMARGGVRTQWYSVSRRDERRALLRARSVLAIQGDDRRWFERLLGGSRPVFEVGHLLPPRDAIARVAPVPERVLYAGSSAPMNNVALDRFVRRIWPDVLRAVPSAQLRIAGGVRVDALGVPGVCHDGRVESLEDWLAQGAAFVNPELVGTGLKIKTIEALACGLPVVSTPSGVQGLDGGPACPWDLAAPDALAAPLIALLRDVDRRRERGERAQRWIASYAARQRASLDAALEAARA